MCGLSFLFFFFFLFHVKMIYFFACLFVCVIKVELITVRKLKSKCSKKETKVGGSLRGNQCLQNVW